MDQSIERRGLVMAIQAGLGKVERDRVYQCVPRAAMRAAMKLYQAGVAQDEIISALARGPKEVESVLALRELGR